MLQDHVDSEEEIEEESREEPSSNKDSLSDEQSIAEEVLDPEAAMAVLRELGNLGLFQTGQRSSEEQEEL